MARRVTATCQRTSRTAMSAIGRRRTIKPFDLIPSYLESSPGMRNRILAPLPRAYLNQEVEVGTHLNRDELPGTQAVCWHTSVRRKDRGHSTDRHARSAVPCCRQ